jgi:hypothetical protein
VEEPEVSSVSKLPEPHTQSLWVYAARDGESDKGNVWNKDYGLLKLPQGWEFLGAGDQFLTRTVKRLGPTWLLCRNDRRRRITRRLGVYASAANIRKAEELALQTEVSREEKRKRGARTRAQQEDRYCQEFRAAALKHLDFAPEHTALAEEIATATAERACQVGSGRVGRTSLLPLEEKVALAVRAHLRHNVTRYDDALFERAMQSGSLETDEAARRALRRAAHEVVGQFLQRHRQPSRRP